jgi:ornithine carbamoyltransferase
MKKDLLTLRDVNAEDCEALFSRSLELKRRHAAGLPDPSLQGKTLGLIFDKPSTRTRVSFEAAMAQLGGTPLFLNAQDTQLIRNEPVADTARALSRYLDGLVVRTYSQDLLEELGAEASIPIVNGLTDMYHPCQVLSDLMTIVELKGGLEGVKIVWVGDGNNVCHSWLNAAAVLPLYLVVSCPEGYQPDDAILKAALKDTQGQIQLVASPEEAAHEADVIYTDVWASMGQEKEAGLRKKFFMPYQVTEKLVACAKPDVIVMHCLPAHRGEEITAEVLEGSHSVVWDQAENKMHMHKGILEKLMGDEALSA